MSVDLCGRGRLTQNTQLMTEHDRSADAVDIKSFYSQLLHLLEFTRDMDRNTDDGKFAKSRGTIHYVLDEELEHVFVEDIVDRVRVLRRCPHSAFRRRPQRGPARIRVRGQAEIIGCIPPRRLARPAE